jgi:hypothetical protein
MGAHNDTANDYQLFATGSQTIADPGSGETFDLRGIDRGVATIALGTRVLPNNVPLGVSLTVYATGSVTITNASASSTYSLRSGDVWQFVARTSTTWVAQVLSTSASSEGTIGIPLMSITGEDGTVLAKQASTTSGWAQLSNKNVVLHIPLNATNEAFSFSTSAPSDIDPTLAVYLDVFVSKSADNDVLTIDAELYAYGSSSGPAVSADLVTTSAQTIIDDGTNSGYTFTCTAPSYAQGFGGVLTLGGTNDGDIVYIHGVRIRYTKKY